MESGSVVKGLIYGGFASCVAETSERRARPFGTCHAHPCHPQQHRRRSAYSPS